MTTLRAELALEAVPALTSPRAQLLLAVGDDDLVSGHRASHWTGVAPAIELDLALATIAQDGINHADLWYQLLLGDELAGDDPMVRAAVDAVALGRAPEDYRHAILCERPPRDIAFTLARHLATDHMSSVRLEALADSRDEAIATLAGKLRWELRYHLEHADHWLHRLAARDAPHRDRFVAALEVVLPEALGFFEPFPGEAEVVAAGILPVAHVRLQERWVDALQGLLEPHGLAHLAAVDVVPAGASGGRIGRHSPDFTDDVWPEMTSLYRAHPGASW